MAVQGAIWLAKRLSLNLNFSFLNRISLLLIQVATQLTSRGWVDPVPDPILPEKFLGYSRESNPGPFGWQSDVLTTIPNTHTTHNSSLIIIMLWTNNPMSSSSNSNNNNNNNNNNPFCLFKHWGNLVQSNSAILFCPRIAFSSQPMSCHVFVLSFEFHLPM